MKTETKIKKVLKILGEISVEEHETFKIELQSNHDNLLSSEFSQWIDNEYKRVKELSNKSEITKFGIAHAFNGDRNIVSIIDAYDKEYSCIFCGEKLIPTHGDINAHHFRHLKDSACCSTHESLFHEYAKHIFTVNNSLKLPDLITDKEVQFFYHDVIQEAKTNDIIPDIKLVGEKNNIYIEIYVTHKIDEEKRMKIYNLNENFLEINLNQYYRTKKIIDLNELENIILNYCSNRFKYWIIDDNKRFAFMIISFLNDLKNKLLFPFEIKSCSLKSFEKYSFIINVLTIDGNLYTVEVLTHHCYSNNFVSLYNHNINYDYILDLTDEFEVLNKNLNYEMLSDYMNEIFSNYSIADSYLNKTPFMTGSTIFDKYGGADNLMSLWNKTKKPFIAFDIEYFYFVLVDSDPSSCEMNELKFKIIDYPVVYNDEDFKYLLKKDIVSKFFKQNIYQCEKRKWIKAFDF